jgi:hypothetical protein
MCSWAILPFSNFITTTTGSSTGLSVGGTPGSINAKGTLWVKRSSSSSTTCFSPTVREICDTVVSAGHFPTKYILNPVGVWALD